MNLFISALSRLLHLCAASAVVGQRSSASRARRNELAGFALLLALAPTVAFAQAQITISPSTLPNPLVGLGYSQTLTATGGTGTKNLVVTAGSLPPGLTLSPAGLISGTPTATGSYIFLVTANDTAGGAASAGYTLVVQGPPTITTPTSANVLAASATLGGTVSSDGGASVSARGVVYALTSINSNPQVGGTGVVSVASTSGGTGAFTVNVTGLTQTSGYSFKAYATNSLGTNYSAVGTFTTGTLAFTPLTLRNALVAEEYNQNFNASGGTPPYTYAVTGGSLPAGLTLTPSGFLSGAATIDGVFSFTITATDAAGASRPQSYVVIMTPAVTITTTALPDRGLNVAGYSFTVEATGGTGVKTFSVTEGTLPPGLTLDISGPIIGTPTVSGTFEFTITATDTANASGSRSFVIVIGGAVTVTTAAVPDASVNQGNYSRTIAASGGTGFKTFSISSGSLPAGMSLGSNGVLNGTPTTAGSYTFAVTATDQLGASASRSFSMTVNAPLAIATATLPNSPIAVAYNQTISTTGGTGGKTFALTNGALPTGLALNTGGVLSGTPTAAGTFSFTITATDASGAIASQTYSLVAGGALVISPSTLTAPVINVAGYSATFSATGGTGGRTFAVTSGALPTGLTLSSAGVLGGMATAAGTFNFTVTVTDAAGGTGSQAVTVVVAPPVNVAQTISFAALPNRLASDAPFVLTATASSGLGVLFNVTGPAVLNGSTLTLTGVPGIVTVTAAQSGNTTFTAAPNVVQTFTVTAANRLANLSSRVRIAPDANRSLITGFVVGGLQPKRVLLRAIGPALTPFGVTGALVNPRLQIFDSGGRVVLENDDWSGVETATAASQVGAFALTVGSRDAAVVTTLAPGSYTMQITAGTETGIALAEVYDASPNPDAETQKLVNISTRGNVEAGDGILIGGFVISGTTAKRVLIRGIGPTLSAFGVAGSLADPRLSVFSGTAVVAQNDDWSTPTPVTPQQGAATGAELAVVAQSVGAFALAAGSRDAAVVVTLSPGAYTAQVAGAGTTTGVALVEIYEVP